MFELLIIATAAAALSDELFGFRAQWLWTIAFGAVALVLALLGPIGFVRRFVRRFAVWAVPLAVLYLTWWALDGADLGALWDAPGEGGLSVWQGADFVVGITVSWIPYAADYTRFSKTRRGAFAGTGLGYLVPDAWLLALGVVLVLSRDHRRCRAPGRRRRRRLRAILALFALLVTETDEAFANAYSAAVSLQNLVPGVPQPLLIGLVTATATAGALVVDLVSYQSLSSCSARSSSRSSPSSSPTGSPPAATTPPTTCSRRRPGGPASSRPGSGVRRLPVAQPDGPVWWTDAVARLEPPDWGLGATVPSFVTAFALGLAAEAVAARRRAVTA